MSLVIELSVESSFHTEGFVKWLLAEGHRVYTIDKEFSAINGTPCITDNPQADHDLMRLWNLHCDSINDDVGMIPMFNIGNTVTTTLYEFLVGWHPTVYMSESQCADILDRIGRHSYTMGVAGSKHTDPHNELVSLHILDNTIMDIYPGKQQGFPYRHDQKDERIIHLTIR